MAYQKLDKYRARELGNLMANKAFEHKTTPLEEQMRVIAERVYENTLIELGMVGPIVEKHIEYRVLSKLSSMRMDIHMTKEDARTGNGAIQVELGYTASWHDEKDTDARPSDPPKWLYSNLDAWDPVAYEQLTKLEAKLRPLYKARYELKEEIEAQTNGKTAKHVIKHWPEATSFVKIVCEMDDPTPMFVPLENLIAKYFPALPAPKEA